MGHCLGICCHVCNGDTVGRTGVCSFNTGSGVVVGDVCAVSGFFFLRYCVVHVSARMIYKLKLHVTRYACTQHSATEIWARCVVGVSVFLLERVRACACASVLNCV